MRPYVRVKLLNSRKYKELKGMARRQPLGAVKVKSAKIVVLSSRGCLEKEIGEKLGCHEKIASRWINRFNKHVVARLEGPPRDGQPPVHGPRDIGAR